MTSGNIVRQHPRPISRSFRSSFLHPRWLAYPPTVFLLFGQQGAPRHVLSHWSEFGEATGVAFNAAATTKPVSTECSQPVQEHATCLQCAAYAALAAVLSTLVALQLAHTRRWHFPRIGFHAGAPVLPVAVCSRDPPIHL